MKKWKERTRWGSEERRKKAGLQKDLKLAVFGILMGCSIPLVTFASSGNPAQGAWQIIKELLESVLYCLVAVQAVRILKDRKITEAIVFAAVCILVMIIVFHPEILKSIADNWAGRL